MQCKHPQIFPKVSKTVPMPCGNCLPCKITRRRIWTHRMMLERSTSETACFLTLTYDDKNLPEEFHNEKTGQIYSENSVNPSHVKTFINTLRKTLHRQSKTKIRYYACGEYGDKTQRPHYHLAIYGYPPCSGSGPTYHGRTYVPCSCSQCTELSSIWNKGHIFLGKLQQESAQYIAGYVTKKLTQDDNPRNTEYRQKSGIALNGRHPEFGRMSTQPGLGYYAAVAFGKKIQPFVKKIDDIPPYLVHNGKKWPLGRYLTNVIRKQTDLPEDQEGEALARYEENLHTLFESKTPVGLSSYMVETGLPDVALRLLNAQKALQIEGHYDRKDKSKGL